MVAFPIFFCFFFVCFNFSIRNLSLMALYLKKKNYSGFIIIIIDIIFSRASLF